MPEMGTRTGRRQKSLADALFSKTQQRVLALLFGRPDRSFFAREIIARTGSGSGAAQRELARLVDSGLVLRTRIGNQTHYQANRDTPLFTELRAIVLKTIGLAEPLREALAPLASRIELAVIYGSVAAGEDRAGSDIDLLVVANDLLLEDLFVRLAPVENMLQRTIHPTLFTSAELARRRKSGNAFLTKVLARETILLIGSQDAVRTA
jgi:predicted nucleotidyltransferase